MARSRESPTRSNPNQTRSQHVLRKTCHSASNRLLITTIFAGRTLIKASRRAPRKGTRRLKNLYCLDSAARSPGLLLPTARTTSFARTTLPTRPGCPSRPLAWTAPPARTDHARRPASTASRPDRACPRSCASPRQARDTLRAVSHQARPLPRPPSRHSPVLRRACSRGTCTGPQAAGS